MRNQSRRQSVKGKKKKSPSQEEMRSRSLKKIQMKVFETIEPQVHPFPKGPLSDAMFSTRQVLEVFTDSVGLVNGNQIVQASASAIFGSIAFEVGDLDGWSNMSSLFDQYRVDRVDVLLKPTSNSLSLNLATSPNQASPDLYVVVDRDDSTALTSNAQLRQYENCRVMSSYQGIRVNFIPSITPAYYQSGSFVGYGIEESRWLDVASSAIPHYGIKFGVEALQTSSTSRFAWNVVCYLHISFRSSR